MGTLFPREPNHWSNMLVDHYINICIVWWNPKSFLKLLVSDGCIVGPLTREISNVEK